MSRWHPTWDLVPSVCKVCGGWMNTQQSVWREVRLLKGREVQLNLGSDCTSRSLSLCCFLSRELQSIYVRVIVRWWRMALLGCELETLRWQTFKWGEKSSKQLWGLMFWAFSCSVGWRMAAFTFNLLNYILSFSSSAFCYLPFSMHTYAYICIGTVVSWVWLPPPFADRGSGENRKGSTVWGQHTHDCSTMERLSPSLHQPWTVMSAIWTRQRTCVWIQILGRMFALSAFHLSTKWQDLNHKSVG